MNIKADNPEEYISQLPKDRQIIISEIRKVILQNLPQGFEETIQYGMISYVVPHSIYPSGYHAKPEEPLPLMSIASQKNHIALYHMAIYADEKLLKWFKDQYLQAASVKLDMGKSCIRFKKAEHIPLELLGKLASKITPEKWITLYEDSLKK